MYKYLIIFKNNSPSYLGNFGESFCEGIEECVDSQLMDFLKVGY
jgi:hypothetical protein